jgi:vancomycin resistance protein YoaR
VSPEAQRAWLQLVGEPDAPTAPPTLALDEEAALAELAAQLPELGEPPVDAGITLEDGVPVVVPGRDGTGCCEPGSGDALLAAMRDGSGTARLEATARPPEITTEDVEAWAIREPVGGSRAWRSGAEADSGAAPGFTTFHNCCESRVTNIHRIADLVRGAVIPPGGRFSVNEHVGRRTRENGFVEAGAIRNGEHVSEVGGGVSQFATTLFNAAYFAGLDILEYQAHSEYFSRYPRGREATMGFPAPDLVIENTTPFGILIWTSYTDTSLTITMYSSPFVLAEQTGISEGRSGNCAVVRTERTRTYPDGSTRTDEFTATYRPGEGRFC